MILGALLKRIERLNVPLVPIMEDVVKDSDIQQRIIEKNQDQLQFKHVTGEGKQITRIYSSVSQSKFGKPNSEITLYDTGEFYGTMKVVTDGDGAKITGDTIKDGANGTVDISGYVGGNPLGLTEQSKLELIPDVKKKFIEEFRKRAGFR